MDFDAYANSRSNLNSSFDTDQKYANDESFPFQKDKRSGEPFSRNNDECLLDGSLEMRDPFSAMRGTNGSPELMPVCRDSTAQPYQHHNGINGSSATLHSNEADDMLRRMSLDFENEPAMTGFLRGTEYDIFGQAEVNNNQFVNMNQNTSLFRSDHLMNN